MPGLVYCSCQQNRAMQHSCGTHLGFGLQTYTHSAACAVQQLASCCMCCPAADSYSVHLVRPVPCAEAEHMHMHLDRMQPCSVSAQQAVPQPVCTEHILITFEAEKAHLQLCG
jgi:hypothetical protein